MYSVKIGKYILASVMLFLGIVVASPLFWSAASANDGASTVQEVSSVGVQESVGAQEEVHVAAVSAVWTKCTPLNVAVFANRVHVKCSESVGGIRYFAAPTASNSHAARVLSVLTAAHAGGATLDILYDPADESGSSIGCNTGDCRLIQGVAYLK